MPKKYKGPSSKSEVARERKETARREADEKKRQEEEDKLWRDDDKQLARKQERKVWHNYTYVCSTENVSATYFTGTYLGKQRYDPHWYE